MSHKRIRNGCRPESAATETTRLTLPSETNLSLTTNSAFKSEQSANQFDDSNMQGLQNRPKPNSTIKKKAIAKQEQKKEQEKNKEEYEKLISKPMKKSSVVVKEEEKKSAKDQKNKGNGAKTLNVSSSKTGKPKEQQPKPTPHPPSASQTKPKINFTKEAKSNKVYKASQKSVVPQSPSEQEIEQRKRSQIAEMQRFVNAMELKNMDLLSRNYQLSIQNATSKIHAGQLQGLQAWNSDLQNQFSDFKFNSILKTIQENEKELQKDEAQSENKRQTEPSIMNMTLSDLQQRNDLFITEINRNEKLRVESISTLEEIQRTQQKIQELQKPDQKDEPNEEQPEDEQQLSDPTTKPTKNPIVNVVQRNIISTSAPYYQCEHLAEEYKQRLLQLLEQIETGVSNTPNPFQLSDELQMHIKLIDEGIRVYRRESVGQVLMDNRELPGDPELRKAAELKVLKSKLQSINKELLQVSKGAVSRVRINELVAKLKQQCLVPKSKTVQAKKQTLKQLTSRAEQSSEFLKTVNSQSKQIESDIQQIKQKLQELESQILNTEELSAEQQKQQQMQSLSDFRQKIYKLEDLIQKLPAEVQHLQAHAASLKCKINRIEQEFGTITIEKIEVPGYKEDETTEDISRVIERKLESTRVPLS